MKTMCLCLVVMFVSVSVSVMAQESTPVEGVTANQTPAPELVEVAPNPTVEEVQEPVAVVVPPETTVRPIVVESGAVLVEAPVTVRVNVPEQPAPIVNITTPQPIVNFNPPPSVAEEKGWCARHPVGCAFLVIGVTGVAVAGGFIAANQFGAFDSSNSVTFR